MAILAGVRSPTQLKANIKNGLLPMQKVSWVISPLSMTFAQNFLAPTTWVPFFNLIAFGKSIFAGLSVYNDRLILTLLLYSLWYLHEHHDQA